MHRDRLFTCKLERFAELSLHNLQHLHRAVAEEQHTKNGRPDIRAHCVQIQIRTSFRRLAVGHGRCLSAHLEATLQHAPQDRAVRKHLQGNIARCGSAGNWYDAHALDCAAFPDELKTGRKVCTNINVPSCASRVAPPSEERNSAAICAQLSPLEARAGR
jgi:hypothetical protein